jgi:hypothetical protein
MRDRLNGGSLTRAAPCAAPTATGARSTDCRAAKIKLSVLEEEPEFNQKMIARQSTAIRSRPFFIQMMATVSNLLSSKVSKINLCRIRTAEQLAMFFSESNFLLRPD